MNLKRSVILLALLAALSAGASGTNIIDYSLGQVVIDPTFSSPNYPGFPLSNMFGDQILTPEGVYDTIFSDSGSGWRNVFFHLATGVAAPTIQTILFEGAQDGPTSPSRSISYLDLYSYTFTDINNSGTYVYTPLYSSGPVSADVNGYEQIAANVNLNNVGPYFVVQFGARDGSVPYPGPRVYDFQLSDTSVPEPSTFVPLALAGAFALLKLRRRKV
jgi:hypothetical protein